DDVHSATTCPLPAAGTPGLSGPVEDRLRRVPAGPTHRTRRANSTGGEVVQLGADGELGGGPEDGVDVGVHDLDDAAGEGGGGGGGAGRGVGGGGRGRG